MLSDIRCRNFLSFASGKCGSQQGRAVSRLRFRAWSTICGCHGACQLEATSYMSFNATQELGSATKPRVSVTASWAGEMRAATHRSVRISI